MTKNNIGSIDFLIENSRFWFQQILVVSLCLIFNILDGFDITTMAVTADAIAVELELAEDQLGIIFAFSLAGMMMGAVFLAPLSDVFGRRNIIIASLFIVGLSMYFTSYITNLWPLITLRFISGLGAGAMLASQAALAAEYSSDRYRALVVTLVTAGYPLGAMMTGLVAGSIIPNFGWRGMFEVGGVLTLCMGILAYLKLPDSLQFLCTKKPRNALLNVNKILIAWGLETVDQLPRVESKDSVEPGTSQDEAKVSNGFQLLAADYWRSTLLLWWAFFMCFCTLYFLMSWIPKLTTNAGFSAEVGNSAFALFNFGGFLGIFALGLLATRLKLSSLVSWFLLLGASLMMFFAGVSQSEKTILGLIFIIGIMLQGGFTGLYACAAKIYPTEIRSTGVGWAIGLGRFGAIIGPAAAGFMISWGMGLGTMFLIFAIPVLMGGIFSYKLDVQ